MKSGLEMKGHATRIMDELEKTARFSGAKFICTKFVGNSRMERILTKRNYTQMKDADDHWCKKTV